MSGIQHEYTLNAVTALSFQQTRDGLLLVLAGEGCFLKVFDALSSELITQCKIFDAQTIHGIANLDQENQEGTIKAAFWGGRSFVLLGDKEIEAIIEGSVETITSSEILGPDWILDGAISPFLGCSTCVFVTAHSAAVRAVKDDSSGKVTWRLLPSSSPSILYSAHALWISPGSIMVAGGTVFGEVEVNVWQDITVDALVSSHHMYTFTGHEGSIFGVRISPEIRCRDGSNTRYLASSSDDRSIRVWDLSLSARDQDLSEIQLKSTTMIRETGFYENKSISIHDASSERCIAARMAHASRIWRVDFINWKSSLSGVPSSIHLLSFGEDSSCKQWALVFSESHNEPGDKSHRKGETSPANSTPRYPAVLAHINSFSYHSGKHVWSTALFFASDISRRLVTGGSDGKVAIYEIFLDTYSEIQFTELANVSESDLKIFTQENLPTVKRSWALGDIVQNTTAMNKTYKEYSSPIRRHSEIREKLGVLGTGTSSVLKTNKKATNIKDSPNQYGFVAENELLVTTSLGRIFYTLISDSCEWQELDLPDYAGRDLKSYSLILGIPGLGIALLAGANGTVYVYHKKAVTELLKLSGKPAALFQVSVTNEEWLTILITTLGSDIAHQIFIAISAAQSPSLEKMISIKLPPSFVVTSAGKIMMLLILGARNGSIAWYDLEKSEEAIGIIPGEEALNDDAVTGITAVPSSDGQDSRQYFLTTTRNGSYSIFSIGILSGLEKALKTISVRLVHRAFPPLGPMIEAAWFSESDLILYGFRGTKFVVWNETKRCEISSIECGGGHRSYAYMPGSNRGGAGHFAYTKASRLHIHSQAQPSHKSLKLGGHGRELKAAATHDKFIATGAEDTVIRIWRIRKEVEGPRKTFISVDGVSGEYGNTSLECCAVLERHTAGIQHLQWCCSSEDHHSLFSAGGAEEFHVWAVSDIPGFGMGVICEATLEDLSEDRDLRIMGFDVEFVYDNRSRELKDRGGPKGKNVITIIYSDSTIKCFDYSRTYGFKKNAEGLYTSACLTNVVCLREVKASQKFFTTSTDGHLVLWERTQHSKAGRSTFSNESVPDGELVNQVPELNVTIRLKLHQSSISTLTVQHLTLLPSNGGLLIATAGDDNAICVTFFYELKPVKFVTIPSAHAASITGLDFKSDVTGGVGEIKWVQLWSVGGDQRVKRWTVEFGVTDQEPKPTMENGLNMRVLGQDEEDDVWTSVADPGGLVEWRDNWDEDHVLIYGNGMEVFRLKDGFPDGTGSRWAGYKNEKPVKAEIEETDEEVDGYDD